MMDVTTGVVTVTTVGAAMKILEPFYAKVIGAVGEGVGNRIGDWFNGNRAINLAKVVARAQEKAKEEGLDPSKIPLKIIHPMLENASLEEDEQLQDRWASLLANAADPGEPNMVLPSFSVILKELQARDATFLDEIYSKTLLQSVAPISRQIWNVTYTKDDLLKIYASAGLSRNQRLVPISMKEYDDYKDTMDSDFNEFEITLATLKRHGLLELLSAGSISERSTYSTPQVKLIHSYHLSQFSVAFILACKVPISRT